MGPEKLLILALIIALVFGAGAVPGIARRAGKGIRGTREALGIDELREEIGEVRSSLSASPTTDTATEDAAPAGQVTGVGDGITGPAHDDRA